MTEITSRLSTALADRYKIERRLGEGGMATVYLAEDLKHKRKVAVILPNGIAPVWCMGLVSQRRGVLVTSAEEKRRFHRNHAQRGDSAH